VIMTNAHVVNGASEVTVRLTDRREYTAKVVGVDPKSDIAIIRIGAKDLPTVKLGDSRTLKVGEWVLAIGAPFGFREQRHRGIVSAKGRTLESGYVPFIQTDVPINPGNSGGPLFNMRARSSASTRRSTAAAAATWGCRSPSRSMSPCRWPAAADHRPCHARQARVVIQAVTRAADSFGLPQPQGALCRAWRRATRRNAPESNPAT